MASYVDQTLKSLSALILADNDISDTEDSSSLDDGVQKGRGKRGNGRGKRENEEHLKRIGVISTRRRITDAFDSGPSINSRCFSNDIPSAPESFRGYVLVIVNYRFPDSPLQRGNDIEEIKKLFPIYGYQVRSFTNQNNKQILSLVCRYSKKEDSGSLICFISSHGDQTSIACTDGSDVKINDIFKKANTDQLRDRPKVFFIDACRSRTGRRVEEKHIPEPPSTEYFIGFSCLGSKSSTQIGSKSCGIYIEALLKVFKDGFGRPSIEYGKSRDINHFMEKVHFLVTEQKDRHGRHLQMPTVRSTLTGKLFLQGQ